MRLFRQGWGVGVAATACFVVAAAVSFRAQADLSVWDGVSTDAQVARGAERYKASCGSCHSDDLLGGSGPALVGEVFVQRWTGSSVADMVQTIRQTMPQDSPDSLGVPGYVDLMAYLLKSNGAPTGGSELPADLMALQRVRVSPRPQGR